MCSYPYYIIHVADLQGVLFLLHLRYGDGLLLFFTSFMWYTMYMNDKKENYYEIRLIKSIQSPTPVGD